MTDSAIIRVLKLSSYLPGIGGGELQTHAIGRAMRPLGIRVRVIDTRGEGGARLCERLDGIPVLRYRTPGVPLLDVLIQQARLGALLNRLVPRCDIVQVNHLSPALLPALGSRRRHGRPVILVPWGSCLPGVGPFRAGPHRALLRAAGRRADLVVALSRGMSRNLTGLWGFDSRRVTVIPNGVDTARFRPRLDAVRPDGMPAEGQVVISTGRLTPAKGYDILIRAWKDVAARHPSARLVILGEGPLRASLVGLAEEEGVGKSVLTPGKRRDVADWLAAADFYVSSSTTEGMSNAVLEAMSSGLPVLATRVSGSEDLIRDGQEGLLVPPARPAELAAALSSLLSDSAERSRMGACARRTIEESYSLAAVAARYRSAYEEILVKSRAAP